MTRNIAKRKMKNQPQQPVGSRWLIIGGGAAFLFVATLVIINIFFAKPPEPVALNAARVLGDANAPVTIEEFGDFQ